MMAAAAARNTQSRKYDRPTQADWHFPSPHAHENECATKGEMRIPRLDRLMGAAVGVAGMACLSGL
jgi:hypothetical protein